MALTRDDSSAYKKGYFFTLDAIIALLILSAAAAVFLWPAETPMDSANMLAHDVVGVLSNLPISAVNQTWLTPLVANGTIQSLNQSVLVQLGEFWTKDDYVHLQELLNITVAPLIPGPYHFDIWVNNAQIFTSSSRPPVEKSIAWRVVSGLDKAKPVRGFIANARATSVRANNTLVVGVSPEGSGWGNGNVTITKYFNMSDSVITSAILQLSVHADTSASAVYVNINNLCRYTRSNFSWWYSTEANVAKKIVTSCLKQDWNFVQITLKNTNYDAHVHPGLTLTINYTNDVPLVLPVAHIETQYFFDDVISRESGTDGSGAWASIPFNIPNGASNVSVTARIQGRNIRDYISYAAQGCIPDYSSGSKQCTTTNPNRGKFEDWTSAMRDAAPNDMLLFLNNVSPILTNGTVNRSVSFTFNQTTFAPYLRNGTNMLAVYFNNYNDACWGKNYTQIYSDPINNRSGSSYINVTYDLITTNPYGLIEINKVHTIGGTDSNDKTFSFTYPAQTYIKSDIYVYVTQLYSSLMTARAGTSNPPASVVFTSPAVRAVPSTLFIDDSIFALSYLVTNYVRLTDSCGSSCDYVNASQYEVRFFIPSFVGYGNVFGTQNEATLDALTRLNATLGLFATATNVVANANVVDAVPSLWGPATIAIGVWT